MDEIRELRAKNPADLLAMVPYLLGFHPEDSVVMVSLGATGTPVHARQDLPGWPGEIPELVHDLARVAVRAGVDRVVVVVYSDDEQLGGAVGRELARLLDDAGVGVPLALRADGDRWFCLGDGRGSCPRDCPPDGTPYDLARHPLTLEAVVDGRVVHPSREALRDSLVATDPDEVDRVAVAVEGAQERLRDGGHRHLVQEGRWVQHRVARFLEDGHRLDSHDVGRLVVAVTSVDVRDVAWAQISHVDARRHVDLWRDVVRRSPCDTLAAPAALLAFAAWLAGDGALGWCAVEVSQEAEPGYSLAGLVTQALAAGVPPSAWVPVGPDALRLFAV